jgi:hypothetical protein
VCGAAHRTNPPRRGTRPPALGRRLGHACRAPQSRHRRGLGNPCRVPHRIRRA